MKSLETGLWRNRKSSELQALTGLSYAWRPDMKADMSFSQKFKTGWTKERLMAYYELSEAQYGRVIKSLKTIWARRAQEKVK